ncbi:hypothetical protein PV328_000978 [Microctonus aethiopoides]|uniref:Mutator-like transposase domain-containing protein n=1 Tax=Microctonus aethiopoides TaxID=144406 RepID=A0AA39FVZ5_9HYME|nr:hypothetical protein PV328_000978 [Microctonus aethiopoides]
MNGYGALIGYFSGLVLDVEILNSACRFCDKGALVSSHDCRKNYEGTAKGMEGIAAKKLVVHSSVLKKNACGTPGVPAEKNQLSLIIATTLSPSSLPASSSPISKTDTIGLW